MLIQSDIRLGKVVFKTITKEMLDVWQQRGEASLPEVSIQAQIGMNKIRQELQGFAAATIRLLAEPERATEIAFEEAEAAISLLRFFSHCNFSPRRISYCTLRGKEHVESAKSLIIDSGKIEYYNRAVIDKSLPYWELTNELITEFKRAGLEILDNLLSVNTRTDFQEALLASLLQYSKNCLAKDPSDKLVNILVALESIILKDENEPIKKNIGERMAALFGQSKDERKEIIDNVSKTYDLRSKFIHHGYRVTLEETETLEAFMMNAWRCLHALIVKSNINPTMTRAQLFSWLDDRRLSY